MGLSIVLSGVINVLAPSLQKLAALSRGSWTFRGDSGRGIVCSCIVCRTSVIVDPVRMNVPAKLECYCDVGVYGERY